MRSSRSVFEIGPRLDVRPQVLPVGGAKLEEQAQGPPFRPGERPGEGKTGRVNVSKPSMMPRDSEPGRRDEDPGGRAWPLVEAASGDRRPIVGCVNTAGLGV